MKSEKIANLKARFEESVNHLEGVECWFARDIYQLLGYPRWEHFPKVVEKAQQACENSGESVSDNFRGVTRNVKVGFGEREIQDILLTRYACYLIAQNGDPRKEEISFAQSYFALQTRKQELIEERMRLNDRLKARKKLTQSEKELSKQIYERGVDQQGFARIRSRGDAVLFGGNTTQDMKIKLEVPSNRPLADFLPEVTIAAKYLANTLTNFNVKERDLYGEERITEQHISSNSTVREALLKEGVRPEDLPPEEDIKKLERKVKSQDKKLLKDEKKKK